MAAGQVSLPSFEDRVKSYAERYNLSLKEAEDVVAYQDDEKELFLRCEFNDVRKRLHSFCDGTTRSRERAVEYLRVVEGARDGTPHEEVIEWWMTRYDQLESRMMERSAFLKKEARDALRKVRVALRAPFDIDLKIDVAKLRMEAKNDETASVDIWDWEEYPKEKTGIYDSHK